MAYEKKRQSEVVYHQKSYFHFRFITNSGDFFPMQSIFYLKPQGHQIWAYNYPIICITWICAKSKVKVGFLTVDIFRLSGFFYMPLNVYWFFRVKLPIRYPFHEIWVSLRLNLRWILYESIKDLYTCIWSVKKIMYKVWSTTLLF
jgi:hypothetical protein